RFDRPQHAGPVQAHALPGRQLLRRRGLPPGVRVVQFDLPVEDVDLGPARADAQAELGPAIDQAQFRRADGEALSNKPCQGVNASIGTDAASTWVSRAGLGAIADGGAQQNSAGAPCAYQSLMPNTSWPTMPSAPTPTAAMAPVNSCPGMAWRRFAPDLVYVVGCHNNSVWVTPTA